MIDMHKVLNRLESIEQLPAYKEICIASLYADIKAKENGRIAHKILFDSFNVRAKAYKLSLEAYMEEVLKIQ